MSEIVTSTENSEAAERERAELASGDVLARGVISNWSWYVVVIVSGFLLPHLVDRWQGPELLGTWDFGWSLMIYIGFLSFGVSSAVNRYVARHRIRRDWCALNEVATSSLFVLMGAALGGVLLTLGFVALVPHLLHDSSPEVVQTARTVVLLLGLACVCELPGGVFNGIITGYERFDVLNMIRVTRDILVLISSILLLLAGYGVMGMAAAVFCGEVAGEITKFFVARTLCPHLRISRAGFRWPVVREMLLFGGKTIAQNAARGGIYQGSSLLVGIFLGPAVLAIYARQMALVMHMLRFIKQYAQVFVPRSSVLHAAGDLSALQVTLVSSTRYGLYTTLPMVVVLVTMGGPLLQVWMGPEYEAPLVLAIMAIGNLLCVSQMGVYSVLMGLGRHGIPAAFDAGAAVVSVLLGLALLGPLQGGLLSAAFAMSLPAAVSGGVLLPIYACWLLRLDVREYAYEVAARPLTLILPLTAVLILARVLPLGGPMSQLLIGGGVGGLVTAILYWRYVLPTEWRMRCERAIANWWSPTTAMAKATQE